MPALTYSVADFQAFTTIRSADVNSKFTSIQTLLNTTKLDDTNIQDDGITRATKLKAGTASVILVNDASGDMGELALADGGLVSQTAGVPAAVGAGVLGQRLQSTGSTVPVWVDTVETLPANYIKSGAVRGGANSSNQPAFVLPAGAGNGRTASIQAASTDFVFVADSVQYTATANISSSTLTAAPSTNNTALIDDATLGVETDAERTKYVGEYGTTIVMDAVGTEIANLVGEWAAFKLDDTVNEEYILAYVKSATELSDIKRGYFYDETYAPIPRIQLSDNDTITLMKLTFLYVKSGNTIQPSYTNPVISAVEPTSPATGDLWFDTVNETWKEYTGSAFVNFDGTLAGICIQDDTDTVAARSGDFFKAYQETNTIELVIDSASAVRGADIGQRISVSGVDYNYPSGAVVADISLATNRASGVSEATSTLYCLYHTDDGRFLFDTVLPYERFDFLGHYHPHEPWRAMALVYNDSSGDLETVNNYSGLHSQDSADINFSTTTNGSVITNSAFTYIHKGGPIKGGFRVRNDGQATGTSELQAEVSASTRTGLQIVFRLATVGYLTLQLELLSASGTKTISWGPSISEYTFRANASNTNNKRFVLPGAYALDVTTTALGGTSRTQTYREITNFMEDHPGFTQRLK